MSKPTSSFPTDLTPIEEIPSVLYEMWSRIEPYLTQKMKEAENIRQHLEQASHPVVAVEPTPPLPSATMFKYAEDFAQCWCNLEVYTVYYTQYVNALKRELAEVNHS